jgi:carbon-monoxide dehydrogenase large subunit
MAPSSPSIRKPVLSRSSMKGMGEGGGIAPPAAIANAVRDALVTIGAEVNEIPITPRRAMAPIKAARDAASSS